MQQYSQLLISALQEEVTEKKKEVRPVALSGGQRLLSFASYTYYRFEYPEELIDHTTEKLHCTVGVKNPVSFTGNIVEFENQFVVIAIPVDFGPYLPQMICQRDIENEYLPVLRLLEGHNSTTDPVTFLFQPYDNANIHNVSIQPQLPEELFVEQREAVNKILNNRVTLLWGPVNSGKSYTLALAAVNYVASGKSVLLVTPSNIATDKLLHQCVQVAKKLNVLCEHEFTRYDLPSATTINDIAPFSFDLIVEKRKEEKKAALKDKISILDKYWKVRQKQALYEDFFIGIQNLRDQLAQLKQKIEQLEEDNTVYTAQLKEASEGSLFSRMKRGMTKEDIEGLQKKLTVIKQELKHYTALNKKLGEEITLKELNNPVTVEEWKEFREAMKVIDEYGGIDSFQKNVDDQCAVNEQMLFLTKRLVCTNVSSVFTNPVVFERQYDMVLIDNAQCMNVPMLYALASLAREKCVVAGDPFQIENYTSLQQLQHNQLLRQDIFLYLAKTSNLHDLFSWTAQNNQWVVQMKSHIASVPKLSSFIASVLYDDNVTVYVSPHAKGKIYFLDTSSLKAESKQYLGKKRILPYNEVHTKLVVHCIKHALLKEHRTGNDIGVMFPFDGPTLYTKLQLRLNGMYNVEVGTPEQFCNRQKAVCIFDTTMAGIDYTMRAIDDKKVGEHHIVRLINTVCSSVKEDLYIVANMEHFQKHYKDRLFTRFLMLLQSQADVVDISFEDVLQRFDGMDLQKRVALFSYTTDSKSKTQYQQKTKHKPEEEDAEFALQMKMMAAKKAENPIQLPSTTGKVLFDAATRVLGYWRDCNLLAQYARADIVFRDSVAVEQLFRTLPFESCENEKQFRSVIEKWNQLLYELSGCAEPISQFCSQKNIEAKPRFDVYKLNALFNSRTDAFIQDSRQKIMAEVTRLFQEILGKPQPVTPAEWTTVYSTILARLEAFLSWIEEELRR